MRGSRKTCQRGSKFDNRILVDAGGGGGGGGIEDPNTTKMDHHQPAKPWHFTGGQILAQH